MSSSPSITTLPSASVGKLLSTYTGSGTDCTSVFYASGPDAPWLQAGPVAETGQLACLPPDWRKGVRAYYSPGVCPSGFSYAHHDDGTSGTSTATCCPEGYVTRSTEGMLTNDYNLCRSWVTSESVATISSYNFSDDSGGNIVFTFPPGTYIDARGVVLQRQETDPLWNLVTQTSTSSSPVSSNGAGPTDSSDSSNGSDGLTTGAKAGIGVGVGIGVLLIIAIVYAAYRIGKGKRQDLQQQLQHQQLQQQQQQQQQQGYMLHPQQGANPYDNAWKSNSTTPTTIPPHSWPHSPQPPPPVLHELHANGPPGELDGYGNSVNEMSTGAVNANEMSAASSFNNNDKKQ